MPLHNRAEQDQLKKKANEGGILAKVHEVHGASIYIFICNK